MKITKLRHMKSKEQVSSNKRKNLANQLRRKLKQAGYVTDIDENFTKIGLRGKCFTVDTEKLGYNARVHNGVNGLGEILNYMGEVGFKRTSTPTWDQRVEFNYIVQLVLKKNKVTATIKSGPFIIMQDGRDFTEKDWEYIAEETIYGQSQRSIIQPLTQEMITHAKNIRKQQAKERR